MKKIVFMIAFLFCLTGCVQKNSEITEPSQVESTEKDEEIVTLVLGANSRRELDDATIEAINQYLLENECSYRIQYKKIVEDCENLTTKEYAMLVEQYVEEGQALDICFLSILNDHAHISSYDILRADGYLENLTPYLERVSGRTLKRSLPEEKWKALAIDGEIYGLNGYAYAVQPGITYAVSKDLMLKYDLYESDLKKGLLDLTDLLIKIQTEEENDNPEFACVNYVVDFGYGNRFSKLYPVDVYVTGICLDENNEDQPLIYKLEDKEYIDFLHQMYNIYSNEEIKVTISNTVTYENNFLNVYLSGLLWENSIEANGRYESVDANRVIISNDGEWVY